jgi:hypothetical protein
VHSELHAGGGADRLAIRSEATTHFNRQSTITINGNRATGERNTIAHHVFTEEAPGRS